MMNEKDLTGYYILKDFNTSEYGKLYSKCWEKFNNQSKKGMSFYSKFLVFLETLEKEDD